MPRLTLLDVESDFITKRLSESPIYIKTTTVRAIPVTLQNLITGAYERFGVHRSEAGGYVIDTYVMVEVDGRRVRKLEGNSQPVNPGDWIVTNPPKQPGDYPNHYAKTDASFHERYERTNELGVYRARGLIRLVKNPLHTDIEIVAYWGDKQQGDSECYICTPVNRQDLDNLGSGKRYLLSASDFQTTYKPVEEVLGPDWRSKI